MPGTIPEQEDSHPLVDLNELPVPARGEGRTPWVAAPLFCRQRGGVLRREVQVAEGLRIRDLSGGTTGSRGGQGYDRWRYR